MEKEDSVFYETIKQFKVIACGFAEWIDRKCVFNINGYFFRDLIDNSGKANEYSIQELWDFFIEDLKTGSTHE